MSSHAIVQKVTQQIVARSRSHREAYLQLMAQQGQNLNRENLSCTNLAHAYAASSSEEKIIFRSGQKPVNLGIISAYNDILSAHQPLKYYPELIKKTALENGAVAQFAAGVPAMCDGVTQGQTGMELSLFSRDVIAQSVAVALSHQLFDGIILLGVCDKIVPGLLIGALRFGHLPALMLPAGPMPSGLSNELKADYRKQFVEGKIGRDKLLEIEQQAYHSPGTCTFYGTANTNQVLMEVLGLNIPGSSFVPPNTTLREKLVAFHSQRLCEMAQHKEMAFALANVVNEYSIVNAMIVMLATGGSTNLMIHLITIASAAGIAINWDDFHQLSGITPLLSQLYPNGKADVNDFNRAGGLSVVIHGLDQLGLLHDNILTPLGEGLEHLKRIPVEENGRLQWRQGATQSSDLSVIADSGTPFDEKGGISLLTGPLGRAIVKVSAVEKQRRKITAPARCFNSQEQLVDAFKAGDLSEDFVAVIKYQGPKQLGMPELHQLTPILTALQSQGLKVALLTDGRMSGASGKILSAIHLVPETIDNPAFAKISDGDLITIDATNGKLVLHVDEQIVAQREPQNKALPVPANMGHGRELFLNFKESISNAEQGASIFKFF